MVPSRGVILSVFTRGVNSNDPMLWYSLHGKWIFFKKRLQVKIHVDVHENNLRVTF